MPSRSNEDDEPLLALVRVAANELAESLATAQQDTNDWSDAPRTDLLVHAALQRCLSQLADLNCWGEANLPASHLLWEIGNSWLATGWLQRRAREKPRGYAGDFELLAKIDSRWVCNDALGRSFDVFFQGQSAPQAVRNRHQWLRREMVNLVQRRSGQAARCVSVGSGPACDVTAALCDMTATQRRSISVTLLDLDPAALEFAGCSLSGLVPHERLVTVRENLFRLARVASKSAILGGADFLSCPGLFDYLGDRDAAALLATFWGHLAPGGRMMVFNFAPSHPSQAYMEWIGNWYLTYRDDESLHRLAERGGIPADCVTVASETTATDHALIVDKPG